MNNQRNLVTMQYCLNEHNQSNFLDFFFDSDSEHFEFPYFLYIWFLCSLPFNTVVLFFCWLSISDIPTKDTKMNNQTKIC